MILYNHRLAHLLIHGTRPHRKDEQTRAIDETAQSLHDHVIICGYGRVGQNIARLLDKVSIPSIALDLDPVRVENATLAGENVCFADASHHLNLEAAGIKRAKALVISFHAKNGANRILQQARTLNRNIPIFVRSYDESETESLYQLGATEVIPESLEASLMLASHLLLQMQVPARTVSRLMDESRADRYDLLRMVFPGHETFALEEITPQENILRAVQIPAGASSVGQTLRDLALAKDCKVTTIRRGMQRLVDPNTNTQLEANDVVVLYGPAAQLEHAENRLLEGP